jgi:hypothetical protein
VLSLDADVLGVARLGWSRPTRALVRREISALRRWDRRPPRAFRTPTLVHDGWWRGNAIAIASPPPAGRVRPQSRLPVDAVAEIARSSAVGVMPLGRTPWWRSIVNRLGGRPGADVVVRWMDELHGRRMIWQGGSHGDLSPASVADADGTLSIRDWGRAGDGVPLGLDAVDFAHRRTGRGGLSRSVRIAARRSAPALRALAVPSGDDALLVACHLAELLARSYEGGSGGPPPPAILAELRRWVAVV